MRFGFLCSLANCYKPKVTGRLNDCLCSYSLSTMELHQWNTSLLIHQVSAVCSWDSSIHDSVHLNRVTSPNERIYLIIKATVQLSHPASMELVLRKRIAVNIYNKQVNTRGIRFCPRRLVHSRNEVYGNVKMIDLILIFVLQSFTQSLKRRMSLKNTLYSCGVTYEIVSNIPKVPMGLC